MPGFFTTFTNCRICVNGELLESERFVISEDTGLILESTGFVGGEIVDLDDAIIAPGFLELQTNGVNGFHFTHFEDEEQYNLKLEETAKYYVTQGITGFWATIPTVSAGNYQKILPSLSPRTFDGAASLLGAHAEGPYLHPSKKGAHNASLFQAPSTPPTTIYGPNLSLIKLITLAPELPNAEPLITSLANEDIRVSLGHSDATYAQGLTALRAGATGLTHTLNAMSPLHHRDPGLAGLISLPEEHDPKPPYYTILSDGQHIHPNIVALLYRAAPHRCILISDSIELAGLPDGVHPGHAQIPHNQVKKGPIATIEGTDTLIGACSSVNEGVKNLIKWSGCSVAEAARCATENVADFMGLTDRGALTEGRKADFVVLNDDGEVLETWVAGKQLWRAKGRKKYY